MSGRYRMTVGPGASDLHAYMGIVARLAIEDAEARERLDVLVMAVGAALVIDDNPEVRARIADLARAALCGDAYAAQEIQQSLTQVLIDHHSPHRGGAVAFGEAIASLIAALARAAVSDPLSGRVECFLIAATRALNAECAGNDEFNRLYSQLAYHSLRDNEDAAGEGPAPIPRWWRCRGWWTPGGGAP